MTWLLRDMVDARGELGMQCGNIDSFLELHQEQT